MHYDNPENGEVLKGGIEVLDQRRLVVIEAVAEMNAAITPEDATELPNAA